jgi:hypothetical protein
MVMELPKTNHLLLIITNYQPIRAKADAQYHSAILLENCNGLLVGQFLHVESGATLTIRLPRPVIGASTAELSNLDLTALEWRLYIGCSSFGVVKSYFDLRTEREFAVKSISATSDGSAGQV